MKNWPCAVAACLCLAGAAVHDPLPTAIFAMDFDDTSLESPRPDEQQRLAALDRQLREAIEQSGCCAVLGGAQQVLGVRTDDACNGCELDLARTLGARISVTGWVQKVSNLILNINVVARDVPTGQIIGAGSVDIRGNTDESWSRGLAYLVRNRLHPSQW